MFKTIPFSLLFFVLIFSIPAFSQVAEQSRLIQTDIKSISGDNTVSITSYKKNGTQYVYVGGFGDVDVFSLDKDGNLDFVEAQELYKIKGPARGMVADKIKDNDFLFVANKFGDAIEVFEIQNNGALEQVFMIHDTEDIHIGIGITLQVVHIKDASYLFAGGLEENPGLSCFKIHGDGKLTHVQSMKDNEQIHTDGIIGMFVHVINDKTFLFTGGFQDNGISSFRVDDDGTFKHVNSISDNTTDRYLTGAYPLSGVTLGNNHYVVVGHRHHKYYTRKGFIKNPDFMYHGDAVSVFKVNKKGKLIPHSVFKDDDGTKLQGQTRIELVSATKNEAIFALGMRDDTSIQLLELNKKGALRPLNYIDTGYSIYYALRSLSIDNSNFLVAGSNEMDFKKVVVYKIVQ